MPPPIAELCLFPDKTYSKACNITSSEPLPGCLHPSLSPPWCLTVYNAPQIQTPHQSLRIREGRAGREQRSEVRKNRNSRNSPAAGSRRSLLNSHTDGHGRVRTVGECRSGRSLEAQWVTKRNGFCLSFGWQRNIFFSSKNQEERRCIFWLCVALASGKRFETS